ncbi:hypothetical protein BABINDRAFT_161484 [Babjeviella inositovora NRRL Y-12698]|uniref:Transcription elongation factor Spt6 n=1 Tax=Babjeviella inositovora NRRL Y-12698 TaxID=984486 RepID=A0A1E3QQ53_9ASCO|nr:uncharacterized protein BABINDRAFT_161484 [Babjeviella inositovora NRRL Y-12698]ODQ79790.1 hypothetical protein BABINDRAFT_161484 [Babjeviella inositovora NRRL Y-12698]
MSAAPSDEEREIQDNFSDEEIREEENMVDSSEEEDDDEDEDAINEVRDGFIVDDEEEDEGAKRKKKKKRRHREKEPEVEALDDDDLELLMENNGVSVPAAKPKFKRLKRAQTDEPDRLTQMFSEEEEEEEKPRNVLDEFDDFIEDDEFSDEDEGTRAKREQKKASRSRAPAQMSNIDNEKLSELFEIFGNGEDYAWALEGEDEGEYEDDTNPTALTDVFEPAELKERMLTEADNQIRMADVPERFQTLRAHVRAYDLPDAAFKAEQEWVANKLAAEKGDAAGEPFEHAVHKVVEFVARDNLEVPFIWNHRRDYFLHPVKNTEGEVVRVDRLLVEDDLWRIVQLDIDYHGIYDKRGAVLVMYEALGLDDDVRDSIARAQTMVELQDLHDYLSFKYSKELRATRGDTRDAATKRHSKFSFYERFLAHDLRAILAAIGISADHFGVNVVNQTRIHTTVDAEYESPEDMAKDIIADAADPWFVDYRAALDAVEQTYAEQLFNDPNIRKFFRSTFQQYSTVDVVLTEKGKVTIAEDGPYADFKYLINRTAASLVGAPDMFLRMLRAEAEGLIVIKVRFQHLQQMLDHMFVSFLASDGVSELAEQWNALRRAAFARGMAKLVPLVCMNYKEDLLRECERILFFQVRRTFAARLDQAPYTPAGFDKGTVPTVLAMSCGRGNFGIDSVVAIMMQDNGKIIDEIKFDANPVRDNESLFEDQLIQTVKKHRPDVIGLAGYNVKSKKLYDVLKQLIEKNQLTVAEDTDAQFEGGEPPLVEVLWVNDETAKLYEASARARAAFPEKSTLAKYCIALARYVQSPLTEYIALEKDLPALAIHPHQGLLAEAKVTLAIESALVDIVNMTGVELGEALRDEAVARYLPYVAGLGARKASGLIAGLQANDDEFTNRGHLVTLQLTGAVIYMNCASFIRIPYDERRLDRDKSNRIEVLDATRIHPEDYDLARKMAADALEFDEEEVKHYELKGGGVIYQLIKDGPEKLDELYLEGYAEELETKYKQKKRATLHMIKDELQRHYEELRRSFQRLDAGAVFRMLTGETEATVRAGAVLPVNIRKISQYLIFATTSSMIDTNIRQDYTKERDDNRSLFEIYHMGQTVAATVREVDYESFHIEASLLREDQHAVQAARDSETWNVAAELADKTVEDTRTKLENRSGRVIKHTLFRNFTSRQAEEFLAPKSRGDLVIRPSSKGDDHVVITWKVSNNLFQHVDILEIQKAGDKVFRVDGHDYSDLDELIYNYVHAIARKVDDMCYNEFFSDDTRENTQKALEERSKNSPKRVCYSFCFDHKAPGWFLLSFKVNAAAKIATWHVRATPDGYRLKSYDYPDLNRLRNGFKSLLKTEMQKQSVSGW